MASQHQHPHQQQRQQHSSQYYGPSQSSRVLPALPHQPSPAVYLQHQHSSNPASYPSTSSQAAVYSTQALPAGSSPPSADSYASALLQGVIPPVHDGRLSALAKYASPAPAASPSNGYLAVSTNNASGAVSSQAQPGVSSRIVSSLQSLVCLLEKQNAKLDKHEERLKTLSESLEQMKTETTRCNGSMESFSKTMSKKLKTLTDTTSKTLQEDIASSLEKDLARLRKETSELGRISKQFTNDDSASKLAGIADRQKQILQAVTANQALTSEQADSVVERINDTQLDLLHRLSDQFRLVTASITTSAGVTRQYIDQSVSRQDQSRTQQIRQLLDMLQSLAAQLFSSPAAALSVTAEETMPTPPISQLADGVHSPSNAATNRVRATNCGGQVCEAVECTSCLIQADTCLGELGIGSMRTLTAEGRNTSHEDEGFHSSSQMPLTGGATQTVPCASPNTGIRRALQEGSGYLQLAERPASPFVLRHGNSSAQSASSHRRRPSSALQPFIMKKRKIIQSDEEEDGADEDAEDGSFENTAIADCPPQSSIISPAEKFGHSFEKVQAWRNRAAAKQDIAAPSQPELVTTHFNNEIDRSRPSARKLLQQ